MRREIGSVNLAGKFNATGGGLFVIFYMIDKDKGTKVFETAFYKDFKNKPLTKEAEFTANFDQYDDAVDFILKKSKDKVEPIFTIDYGNNKVEEIYHFQTDWIDSVKYQALNGISYTGRDIIIKDLDSKPILISRWSPEDASGKRDVLYSFEDYGYYKQWEEI